MVWGEAGTVPQRVPSQVPDLDGHPAQVPGMGTSSPGFGVLTPIMGEKHLWWDGDRAQEGWRQATGTDGEGDAEILALRW